MIELHWVSAGLFGLAAALAGWRLSNWLRRWYADQQKWVHQTMLRFSPRQIDVPRWTMGYLLLRIGTVVVMFLLFPNPVVLILTLVAVLFLPRRLADWAWEQRRNKINDQMAGTVATMANSVHAGLSLVQAIQRLAEQSPDPIRTEFRIMANRYALGADLEATILEAKRRLALPNWNLFASALLVNRQMGGDVATTLDRISQSLERLHEMHQTVHASTSEGRANIKVLCLAPFFILGMLYMMDKEGVRLMFTTPQGWVVLLIAATLTGAGVFWASKIIGTEV